MKVSKNSLIAVTLFLIIGFLAGYMASGPGTVRDLETAGDHKAAVLNPANQLEEANKKIFQLQEEKTGLEKQLTEAQNNIVRLNDEINRVNASVEEKAKRQENIKKAVMQGEKIDDAPRKVKTDSKEAETKGDTYAHGANSDKHDREEGSEDTLSQGFPVLADTEWLARNLGNPKVKAVFVDNWPSEKDDFEKKHIKGSVYMGIGALMGALGDGSAPPDKKQYEAMMQRLGISNGDHIVLYGAKGQSVFTLAAFWLAEYFGHDRVSYLNGGLAKWNSENLPSESGMKAAVPGTYRAASANEAIRADDTQVLRSLGKTGIVLVDARGTGEYKGEVNNEKNRRTGHIPGARDLGFENNFRDDDGTVKSAAVLRAMYAAMGVTPDKEVITYCQAGIKASNDYYILKHVLGYPNVRVYVGSWGEWGNRVDFEKYPAEK